MSTTTHNRHTTASSVSSTSSVARSAKSDSGPSSNPPNVQEYKKELAKVVSKHKAIPAPDDPSWKELNRHLDESSLKDAYKQSNHVARTLQELLVDKLTYNNSIVSNIRIVKRPAAKLFARFDVKRNKTDADANFKSQGDMLAFRIMCDKPQHIYLVINRIKAYLQSRQSAFDTRSAGGYIRPRFPVLDSNGKINNICVNMDSYWPDVGYMIELQIGMEIATYMFCRNSWFRDHPSEKSMPNFKDKYITETVGYDLFKQIKDDCVALQSCKPDVTRWFQAWEARYGKHNEQCEKDKKKFVAMLGSYMTSNP